MKHIKKFNEEVEIEAQDMMNIPTSVSKREKTKGEITNHVNRFVNQQEIPFKNCSDYLQKSVDQTFENGGNGQNLIDNMENLAAHIDDSHKDSPRGSMAMERGWYTDDTVEAFKSLVDIMSREEIQNNNMEDS